MSEIQVIHTAKYGDMRVKMWGHEAAKPIAWLENDSFAYDSGLAVADEKELRGAFSVKALTQVLEAFRRRYDDSTSRRAITIQQSGMVVYADSGEAVETLQEAYDYFPPGPFRDAVVAFFANKIATEKMEAAIPGRQRKEQAAKKAAGKKATKSKGAPSEQRPAASSKPPAQVSV